MIERVTVDISDREVREKLKRLRIAGVNITELIEIAILDYEIFAEDVA